jgi:hypothetical protein
MQHYAGNPYVDKEKFEKLRSDDYRVSMFLALGGKDAWDFALRQRAKREVETILMKKHGEFYFCWDNGCGWHNGQWSYMNITLGTHMLDYDDFLTFVKVMNAHVKNAAEEKKLDVHVHRLCLTPSSLGVLPESEPARMSNWFSNKSWDYYANVPGKEHLCPSKYTNFANVSL